MTTSNPDSSRISAHADLGGMVSYFNFEEAFSIIEISRHAQMLSTISLHHDSESKLWKSSRRTANETWRTVYWVRWGVYSFYRQKRLSFGHVTSMNRPFCRERQHKLSIWTTSRLRQPVHRTYNTIEESRCSIPCYSGADLDVVGKTLPPCVRPGNPSEFLAAMIGDCHKRHSDDEFETEGYRLSD